MLFDNANWFGTSKCNPQAVELYSRHYSSAKNGKSVRDWLSSGITAPGESITLVTPDVSALFVWLKQKYVDNGQAGVNCAVFRNESRVLSSVLILNAEVFAWAKWPGERLYTYVDPQETKKRRGKRNKPGHCFIMAGWVECGVTPRGLVILEKLPSGPTPHAPDKSGDSLAQAKPVKSSNPPVESAPFQPLLPVM